MFNHFNGDKFLWFERSSGVGGDCCDISLGVLSHKRSNDNHVPFRLIAHSSAGERTKCFLPSINLFLSHNFFSNKNVFFFFFFSFQFHADRFSLNLLTVNHVEYLL